MSKIVSDGRNFVKTKAVFTIQHNEKLFLPIWLSHYSKYFNPQDIYVICHRTEPEIMEELRNGLPFQERILDDGKLFDHEFLRGTVRNLQKELLEKYEYVLFSEVDEIVEATPPKKLGKFIDSFSEDYTYCTGYEIIHNPKEEPPLDFTQPLLQQRKYWGRNIYYHKPLLSRIPLHWIDGFHALHGDPAEPEKVEARTNPDLLLLHLKRIDYDEGKKRWHYTHTKRATTDVFASHFNTYNHLMKKIPKKYKRII